MKFTIFEFCPLFLQAVEKVEETSALMQNKMTAALERIVERLDRLEAVPVNSDPLVNVSIAY